jgi:hypothetical protein
MSVKLRPLTNPLSNPQSVYESMWSSGGIVLTGESRRTGRKTCPSATLFTKNPTCTSVAANPFFRCEKATDAFSKCLPSESLHVNCIFM